jgi:sulfate transport system substrate-binding protein
MRTPTLTALLLAAVLPTLPAAAAPRTILNVSYDPTRELYKDLNRQFEADWKAATGEAVEIRMSHGGSGKQARAVIDGLEADVVTLALGYDIDAIVRNSHLIPADWRDRLPEGSAPYTSTIVFLVRRGNPAGIRDWGDLVKPGIQVITPNPKTSGGARWNYLAAWGYALNQELGDFSLLHDAQQADTATAAQQHARSFVSALFARVPVLDSGARGSTTTFAQRGIGDVLLAWENEAFLAVRELGPDTLEIVVPSISVRAQPPVALVEANAKRHGTVDLAEAYLKYLYSPAGQRTAAKHYYRPAYPQHADPADLARFAAIEQFTVDDAFGGWAEAQREHFDDGGVFDRISKP